MISPTIQTKHVYRYDLVEPILVSEAPYAYLITRVDITFEDDGDGEGVYEDYDAYGYSATKTGKRDMRSGLTRVWPDREAIAEYIADAKSRYSVVLTLTTQYTD